MQIEPLVGEPVRFPLGRIAIRLGERHRNAYRRLYARYGTVVHGLPVLRDADFDGRPVNVSPRQLKALNEAFARLSAERERETGSVFEGQEANRTGLFKRLQYLS